MLGYSSAYFWGSGKLMRGLGCSQRKAWYMSAACLYGDTQSYRFAEAIPASGRLELCLRNPPPPSAVPPVPPPPPSSPPPFIRDPKPHVSTTCHDLLVCSAPRQARQMRDSVHNCSSASHPGFRSLFGLVYINITSSVIFGVLPFWGGLLL